MLWQEQGQSNVNRYIETGGLWQVDGLHKTFCLTLLFQIELDVKKDVRFLLEQYHVATWIERFYFCWVFGNFGKLV